MATTSENGCSFESCVLDNSVNENRNQQLEEGQHQQKSNGNRNKLLEDGQHQQQSNGTDRSTTLRSEDSGIVVGEQRNELRTCDACETINDKLLVYLLNECMHAFVMCRLAGVERYL